MGRGRTRTLRFFIASAVVVAIGAVTATVAHALAFDDAKPCPVTIENGAPLFVCPNGSIGTPYSLQIVARGGCEPEFTFRVINGGLPAGLSMSSSGLISGTPTQSGQARFWLQVHDLGPSEGGPAWCTVPRDAEREFSITIDSALRLVTNTIPNNASVGVPYSTTLQAALVTGGSTQISIAPETLTWNVIGGTLPPGLTVANGVIGGTPTTEGTYQFQVQAALDGSRKHSQTYTLIVRQPLKIAAGSPLATPPLPTAWEVGVPFAAKLTPSGGSATYTFTLKDGTLPTGLALGADGAIIGTPRAAGVFRATVALADNEGRTLDYAADFAVASKLAISTAALRPGKVGRSYRASLKTTGGISPKTWRVAGGPLPKGLRLDRKLGVVSGIPKKPGSYRVRFEAKDGLKVAAQKTLRIVVAP